MELSAHFVGLMAGLVQLAAQLGGRLALAYSHVVGGPLSGARGRGLEAGRGSLLLRLLDFGITLSQAIVIPG